MRGNPAVPTGLLLAAAAAAALLVPTEVRGQRGTTLLPPYSSSADIRQDCRYRRDAERLRVGNGAAASLTVSGALTVDAGCLFPSDILGHVLPMLGLFGVAGARNPDLLTACTLPLEEYLAIDVASVAVDVLLRQFSSNGSMCTCAGGFTSAEKVRFVDALRPLECYASNEGGIPAVMADCQHLQETAADLEMACSYAAEQRDESQLRMVHLTTPGRLILDQCGSPSPVAIELYAGPHGLGNISYEDPAGAPVPWQFVHGLEDNQRVHATIQSCRAEPGNETADICGLRTQPVFITEWLAAGMHALLISRGNRASTSDADFTVGIKYIGGDDERGLLARSELEVYRPVTDTTTLAGLGSGGWSQWGGIAHSPETGLLFAAPWSADSVLIINPVLNTTDTTALAGLGNGGEKWGGIAYSPETGLLFAAPYYADSVLIINPVLNTTDTTALAGLGNGGRKWGNIAHAPVTGLLYATPHDADSVLIINPVLNTTDTTALAGLGTGSAKWRDIAHSPETGLLFAAPYHSDSVLIINPVLNTTDTTTMAGLGNVGGKWGGLARSPETGLLYAGPLNANSVLIINPVLNTTDTTTLSTWGWGVERWEGKWSGLAYSPETGLLYAAPLHADSVLIINPMLNTTDATPFTGLRRGGGKWIGIAHSPETGLLFAAPSNADGVLIINPLPMDGCVLRYPCAQTCLVQGCGWNDDQGLCRESTTPTTEAAIRRHAGRYDGDSCPLFRLEQACAENIQAQYDAFSNDTEFNILGAPSTIPAPQWTDSGCAGDDPTSELTSSFLSPTNDNFHDIDFVFDIAPDDGGPLDPTMYAVVDPLTRVTTVSNGASGNYTGRLMALDGGVMGTAPFPQRAVVATLRFEVRDSNLTLSERCKAEYDQIQRDLDSQLDAYFVGEVVSVEGVSHNCTPANGGFESAGDADRMTFRLRVADSGNTDSFDGDTLVDTSTGQVLIRARDGSVSTEYTAKLIAIDSDRHLTIATWTIAPGRRPDTFNVANGPDGRACVNGAPIDTVEFDSQYECDCSGTDFTGGNCEVSPAVDLAAILGSAIGGVIGLVLVGLAAVRVNSVRKDKQVAARLRALAHSTSTTCSAAEMTEAMFEALDVGLDELVPELVNRGADPTARHPATQQLAHGILLARLCPEPALLQQLFSMHCQVDSQIGALLNDPEKHSVLQAIFVFLATSGWREPATHATALHCTVNACRLGAIPSQQALALSEALLAADSTLLTAKDSLSRTAGDIAMQCDGALRLQRLLTIVLHSTYQLTKPNEHLYRSPTALVMECRLLSEDQVTTTRGSVAQLLLPTGSVPASDGLSGGGGGGGGTEKEVQLVIKLMSDSESWHREILLRDALPAAVQGSAIVPVWSVAASSPNAPTSVGSFRVIQAPRDKLLHEQASLLIERFPFALCMERADRNLLEIISNERLAAEPLDRIRLDAQKIGACISSLHSVGIIHADIKPRNIVRTAGASYRLIDLDMSYAPSTAADGDPSQAWSNNFNVSRSRSALSSLPDRHAPADKIRNSNAYMPAELVRWASSGNDAGTSIPDPLSGGVDDAIKLDVWSFGLTLFTMTTGSSLIANSYDHATPAALERLKGWAGMLPVEEAQIRELHQQQDTASLLDLLHWTTDPDPRNRPDSMSEVLGHAFFEPASGAMRKHFVVDHIKRLLAADPGVPRPARSVMVSYCWADTAFVLHRLCLALAPLVEDMWLDRLGGDQGMGEWTRDSMERGVVGADVIISVVSPQYIKSKNCGFEMELAAKHGKTVVPIKLGVPFPEWPPARIGETAMTNQYANVEMGDTKLFVDFEDPMLFETKFRQELLPRMLVQRSELRHFSDTSVQDLQRVPDQIGVISGGLRGSLDGLGFGFDNSAAAIQRSSALGGVGARAMAVGSGSQPTARTSGAAGYASMPALPTTATLPSTFVVFPVEATAAARASSNAPCGFGFDVGASDDGDAAGGITSTASGSAATTQDPSGSQTLQLPGAYTVISV